MNARSLQRRGLTLLRVRARPGHKTRGILVAGPLAVPVVLGRGGVRANKFEGDGATPRGRFRLVRLWWRAGRHPPPRAFLPVPRITPDGFLGEGTAHPRHKPPLPPPAPETSGPVWGGGPPPPLF